MIEFGVVCCKRRLLTLIGRAAAVWPVAAHAQSTGMLRVGMVAAQPRSSAPYTAFLQRLAELGYQQGRNLAFEFIQATNSEDYDHGNRELIRRGVDILVAPGPKIALKSALAASNTLPIVMLAIDYDPIALGYVTSFSQSQLLPRNGHDVGLTTSEGSPAVTGVADLPGRAT